MQTCRPRFAAQCPIPDGPTTIFLFCHYQLGRHERFPVAIHSLSLFLLLMAIQRQIDLFPRLLYIVFSMGHVTNRSTQNNNNKKLVGMNKSTSSMEILTASDYTATLPPLSRLCCCTLRNGLSCCSIIFHTQANGIFCWGVLNTRFRRVRNTSRLALPVVMASLETALLLHLFLLLLLPSPHRTRNRHPILFLSSARTTITQ